MRPVNRAPAHLHAAQMKTYVIDAPTRVATCAEVDCPHYLNGWRTVIDETTEQGQRQAVYVRQRSGRRFTEARAEGGLLTEFTFYPGQRCFTEHHVHLDEQNSYLVRGGDWRGNPLGVPTYRHTSADSWVDDFATHQERLRRAQS